MSQAIEEHTEKPTQAQLDRFVQQQVFLCLSPIINTLAKGHQNGEAYEELSELCEKAQELFYPLTDYEEALRQEDFEDRGNGFWAHDEKGFFGGGAEAICADLDIEPYEWEILEHWAVSEWLAEQLEERGQRIDRDFDGLCVWGRINSGQAISMDPIIREIWVDLHKGR